MLCRFSGAETSRVHKLQVLRPEMRNLKAHLQRQPELDSKRHLMWKPAERLHSPTSVHIASVRKFRPSSSKSWHGSRLSPTRAASLALAGTEWGAWHELEYYMFFSCWLSSSSTCWRQRVFAKLHKTWLDFLSKSSWITTSLQDMFGGVLIMYDLFAVPLQAFKPPGSPGPCLRRTES